MLQNGLNADDRHKAVDAFKALGVCEQLAEAAADLGWKQPSEIQKQAIPQVLAGERCPGDKVLRANMILGERTRLHRLHSAMLGRERLQSAPPVRTHSSWPVRVHSHLLTFCRQGCHRPGADWQRQDGCICLAHPSGAA